MRLTTARRVLHGLLLVLVLSHLLPPWPGAPWMVAGFLPWDLAYHLLWMAAAAAAVLWMTGPAWPDEPPPPYVEPSDVEVDGGGA